MFNLHITPDTRYCCEHHNRFDMLRIVVSYMLREQAGMGVVAVSPRYALRLHQKFSQFWPIPANRLRGILNSAYPFLAVFLYKMLFFVEVGFVSHNAMIYLSFIIFLLRH